MNFGRELFAEVVAELVEEHGFVPPLSMVGVADDGSMFGVRFAQESGKLQAHVLCQHVEIQFGLPMNVMIVDDTNKAARVFVATSGERTLTVL
ncbi:MAG TPA: hypothetical protein VJ233_10530 [Hyphomicrobiaceae bacterium]|nr:hypothetical protein [Hyphomicrobiaceae bacterium]